MSIKLKIKAVSLQDEARYIRKHDSSFNDTWDLDRVRAWFASEEGARLAA